MVETRCIRRARELLNRNRFRVRLEERIKESYYYSITYHRRKKEAQSFEGLAPDAQHEQLTRFEVIFSSTQNINANDLIHILSSRYHLISFVNQIYLLQT